MSSVKLKNHNLDSLDVQTRLGLITISEIKSVYNFAQCVDDDLFVMVMSKLRQINVNLVNLVLASIGADKQVFADIRKSVLDDILEFMQTHQGLMDKMKIEKTATVN